VRADADTDSLIPRFYREAQTHIATVFAADQDQTQERGIGAPDAPVPEGLRPVPMNEDERAETEAAANPARGNLLEARRRDPTRPSASRLSAHQRLVDQHDRS
jgi:hypothetical protein